MVPYQSHYQGPPTHPMTIQPPAQHHQVAVMEQEKKNRFGKIGSKVSPSPIFKLTISLGIRLYTVWVSVLALLSHLMLSTRVGSICMALSLTPSFLATLCIYPHLKLFEIRVLIARRGPVGGMSSEKGREEQTDEPDGAVLECL